MNRGLTGHDRIDSKHGSPGLAIITVALIAAFVACQVLIGGTRLLFSFPAYGLLTLAGLAAVWATRSVRSAGNPMCLASSVVFFTCILLRALASPDAYLARFDIYSVLAGLIVYFITATALTDAKRRTIVVVTLLGVGVVQAIIGAIQFRNGDNWMPLSFLQRFDYGRRASGFYICPNHLAGLLEVLGVFGLSISLWSRWPAWSKLLTGYATVICYLGVILTGSRGGYLSTLFSLFIFVIMSVRLARASGSALHLRLGLAALLLIMVAGVATTLLIRNNDYLTTRTKSVVDNKNIRLDFWRAALKQWETSPVLGTGSRTYLYYARRFREPGVQIDPVFVHNDYLQLLAEYGVVGLVTFLLFLSAHLRAGLIAARRLGPRRIAVTQRIRSNTMALNLGAVAALAAYLVHSFFDFNLHIPANLLLMAFVFGILANSGVQDEEKPGAKIWRAGCRLVILALSIALCIQIYRLSPGEWYAERARTALRDHRPVAGLGFALKGLNFEQKNPQLFYYLGRARYLAGEEQTREPARHSFYSAALPAYESAMRLAPMDETYGLELAFTLDSLGRYSEAEWLFQEGRKLDPRSEAWKRYYEAHLARWRGATDLEPDEPVASEPPA